MAVACFKRKLIKKRSSSSSVTLKLISTFSYFVPSNTYNTNLKGELFYSKSSGIAAPRSGTKDT